MFTTSVISQRGKICWVRMFAAGVSLAACTSSTFLLGQPSQPAEYRPTTVTGSPWIGAALQDPAPVPSSPTEQLSAVAAPQVPAVSPSGIDWNVAIAQSPNPAGGGGSAGCNSGCGCHAGGGIKSVLARRGIGYEFYATQFYQGVASGGREQDWEYGGKLDLLTKIDGHKAGLWEGLFIDAHLESRLGQSVNDINGLLAPSNIAMAFPEMDGNVTALTGLRVTQALSENFAVFAGKINTLDEFPIRYNPAMGLGRPGLGGFMNTSLVFNPIAARTVTYSAAGAGFVVLQDLQPVFSFSVFDPVDRATEGLDDLYERGVVLVPDFIFRTNFGCRPGTWNLGGTYSNTEYTSVDPSSYLNLSPLAGPLPVETGSWSLYANFFQALWVDPSNVKRSWGVFGGLGLSDGNPNPIKYTTIVGLGGQVMRADRTADTFGLGLFNLGLSSQFEALTAGILPQQDEYGLEWFYNAALTKNLRLTGDLQVVRPSTVGFETAIVPGLRLQAAF